jgi:urease accessory protein
MAVITNDIYTREDARMLIANSALPAERIMGVETGGCPHTAIRDDISMNLDAIDELKNRFSHLDVILLESGGDNLTATFSPELVDVFIYVIDVTEGDDIPRKGGPAIEYSDLLLINKVTLAPYVEANTELMESDTKHKRPVKPFYFTDLKAGAGLSDLEKWFRHYVLFTDMDE